MWYLCGTKRNEIKRIWGVSTPAVLHQQQKNKQKNRNSVGLISFFSSILFGKVAFLCNMAMNV